MSFESIFGTIWLFHIAMERSTIFKFGKPSINGPFSITMLVITRGYISRFSIMLNPHVLWLLNIPRRGWWPTGLCELLRNCRQLVALVAMLMGWLILMNGCATIVNQLIPFLDDDLPRKVTVRYLDGRWFHQFPAEMSKYMWNTFLQQVDFTEVDL